METAVKLKTAKNKNNRMKNYSNNEMKTLMEMVIAADIRNGKPAAKDENGEYWVVPGHANHPILQDGGDFGQDRFTLELRHYRNGNVAAVVVKTKYRVRDHKVPAVLGCKTAGEAITALLRMKGKKGKPLMYTVYEVSVMEYLLNLGLPEAAPSFDGSPRPA